MIHPGGSFYLAASGLTLCCMLSFAVRAQPDAGAAGEPEQTFVSAARFPQPLREVLRPISILNREDIERSQARNLAELLSRLPGLQFGRTGGRGALTGLFMRGSGSAQLLTLVDGARIAGASSGAAPWESLPLEQIERIEAVRGAHSALYGSDAIGGLVQIFTRGAAEDAETLRIGFGNRSRIESAAHIARRAGPAWFSLHLAQSDTEGVDYYQNAADDPVNNDRDAFRELSLKFAAGREWENGARLRLDYLETRNEAEYDSAFLSCSPGSQQEQLQTDGCFPGRRNENLISAGSVELEFSPSQRWRTRMRLQRARNEQRDPGRSVSVFNCDPAEPLPCDSTANFDTLRDSASWQNEIAAGENAELAWGVDYYRDRMAGAAYQLHDGRRVRDRENVGVFAEYLLQAGAHSLALTARLTDNEQYGRENTGGVDWGLRLAEGLLLTASVGRAFRAPTFNDLYFPCADFGCFSNPELEPETSLHRELSLKAERDDRRWAAHVFRNDLDDAIVLDRNFTPQNSGDATVSGVEFEYLRRWKELDLSASFAFLDPKEPRADAFARRARREFKLRADYGTRSRWLGAELLARSERYDAGRRLPGYATVDLYGGARLGPEWRLQFRLSNLLDRDYVLASNYNTEGFGVFVSLTWSRGGDAGAGRGI